MNTHDNQDDLSATGDTRRGFLGVVALIAGVMGAMIAGAVVPLFAAPLLKRRVAAGGWVPIGKATDFGVDRTTTQYTFQKQDGWYTSRQSRSVVVGKENGRFLVFSTTCTHLGCAVHWVPDTRTFVCPCHNGEFDANGNVVKPPPDKPLAKLDSRVNPQTGLLEVREGPALARGGCRTSCPFRKDA